MVEDRLERRARRLASRERAKAVVAVAASGPDALDLDTAVVEREAGGTSWRVRVGAKILASRLSDQDAAEEFLSDLLKDKANVE